MTKVRKGVTVFKDGALVKVDLDAQGKVVTAEQGSASVASAVQPAAPKGSKEPPAKPVAPAADKGPSKQEVMQKLKAAGISFKATLKTSELLKLLPSQEPTTPATPVTEPEAKSESSSTGDQDVI